MRTSDRFASVLSDLMFLLLLSVLSVFASQADSSTGEFDGLVNPTRTLSLELASLDSVQLRWNGGEVIQDPTANSGITDDGIVWSWIEPPGEVLLGELTLYFAGTVASGMLEYQSSDGGLPLAWIPNRRSVAESGIFEQARFQLDSTSIHRLRGTE